MTVGQFQEVYKISNYALNDEDKAVYYVKAMTGYNSDEINAMSLKQFNKICSKVTKAFSIKMQSIENGKPQKFYMANGNLYRFNYDLKRPPFNAGSYIDVATFSSDLIGNLHLILASMATPYRFLRPKKTQAWQHELIAEDMKQLDFAAAYHAAVFFYAVFTESMKVLHPFLAMEMIAKMIPEEEANKILQDLHQTLGGFTTPKWYRNLKLSA
jgi:phage-related protein